MSSCDIYNKLKPVVNTVEKFGINDSDLAAIINMAKSGHDAKFIDEIVFEDLTFGTIDKAYKKYFIKQLNKIVKAVKEGHLNSIDDLKKLGDPDNITIKVNYKALKYNLFKLDDDWSKDKDVLNAIKEYTNTEYNRINQLHRNKLKNDYNNLKPDELNNYTELNKLFMYKGNFCGETYRAAVGYKVPLKEVKEGDIVISHSPLSTSKDKHMAFEWNNGNIVSNSNQEKVIWYLKNDILPQYDIFKYSTWPDELEVLIEPNLPFKILSKGRTSDGTWHIKAELIPLDSKDLINKKSIINLLSFSGATMLLGIDSLTETKSQ